MKELMQTPVIVDGRNVFDRGVCEQSGFVYRGVGKGDREWRSKGAEELSRTSPT